MSHFFQGLVIGFSIAAPVGPIGLLCIRRSLADGRLAGLVSGLGAATADALYGILAALGLTAVTDLLLGYQLPLQFIGGLFLVYLGIAIMRSNPATDASNPARTPSLSAAYFSTLALTLANPITILSFLGLFAGLGVVGDNQSPFAAFTLVVGVFLGSAAWWLVLSTAATALGKRLRSGGLRLLNLASGALIAAFGFWHLYRLV